MKKIKSRWMAFGIFFMCITFPAYAGELSPGLSEKLQYTPNKEHIAVIVRMVDQAKLKTSTHDITDKNKDLRSRKVIRALKATAIN
ncbi:MAG: hypothetical protein KAJ08_09975, partial [Deltaproteobacteria bacterium]|nr:hypothetical protein [Deltaproteobacteria bacterium]